MVTRNIINDLYNIYLSVIYYIINIQLLIKMIKYNELYETYLIYIIHLLNSYYKYRTIKKEKELIKYFMLFQESMLKDNYLDTEAINSINLLTQIVLHNEQFNDKIKDKITNVLQKLSLQLNHEYYLDERQIKHLLNLKEYNMFCPVCGTYNDYSVTCKSCGSLL